MNRKLIFLSLIISGILGEVCHQTPSSDLPPMIPEVPWAFNETYLVIELDPSTGAKCLDGSNFKFYYTKGSGSGANKWMFSWQGGGFCGVDGYETLESCFYRSFSFIGSSRFWGENGTYFTSNFSQGYFSNMEEYNPDFWNWNKVLINYCDGSNHQGSLADPLVYNGTNLWFRGFNNTYSVFEYLRTNLGLFEASEVILSGGSAGGQATYFWSAYLQNYFPESIKLMAIPDAGMFLDMYNNITECHLFRYLNQKIANYTNSRNLELFKYCPYFGTDEVWKCMVAEYILDTIRIPMFIVNSQDDSEAMRTQFGVPCISKNVSSCTEEDFERVAQFRNRFLSIALGIKEKRPQWGFWLRTCFEHVYQGTWAWYGETKNVFNRDLGTSMNLRDALHFWYNDGQIEDFRMANFIDVLDWEHNPNCNYNKSPEVNEDLQFPEVQLIEKLIKAKV